MCIRDSIASTKKDNLWQYKTPNGTLQEAMEFMLPSIRDKNLWSYPKDVQHFEDLPIQSANLLFSGLAYDKKEYLQIWKELPQKRSSKEIDRNFPIRQLSLWITDTK